VSDEREPAFLDAQLSKARRGDRAALAVLVRAHQRSVYSLSLRMLGVREAAEDLTQDVFMQLSANVNVIESSQHLAFWLRKVSTHRAIDHLRRRSRLQTEPLDEEALGLSVVDNSDPLLHRHISSLLSQLSPPARAVVLLRYQEDLDPIDIARTLDMSINTVKSHLKRSLDLLRSNTPGAADSRCEGSSP
jgi:RNA polymerase sigma-70 factor (ECF subfamily)